MPDVTHHTGVVSGPISVQGRAMIVPSANVTTVKTGEKGDKGDRGEKGNKGDKGAAGIDGPQGLPGAIGGVVSVTASTNIPAFSAITSAGDRADSSNILHFGKIIGITKTIVFSGFIVEICQIGELENLNWAWITGQEIFLNGNSLSSVSPISGFVQRLGIAKNSTTIIVELESPVLL